MKNYMRPGCNPTSRKFFEDYDLLPIEVKKLLMYGPTMPTFDDLKAAWEIAAQTWNLESVKAQLHIGEEEREEARRADRERKKREREEAKRDKWLNKYVGRQQYSRIVVDHSKDKHGRLIKRITDEEAARLIAKRKENKDVQPAGKAIVNLYVGRTKEEPKKDETQYQSKEIKTHITKQWHNG